MIKSLNEVTIYEIDGKECSGVPVPTLSVASHWNRDSLPKNEGPEAVPGHPVREYLDALTWDGVPRIDRWLVDLAGADDTPEVRAASRAMLVAAVRRARCPGCRFESMPVFEGPQESGKSAALRLLAVRDEWFADFVPIGGGDAREIVEATAGKWIVEASELEDLLARSADAEEDRASAPRRQPVPLKAFLSRTHDEARLPYQRERTRVPRSFVVVGTTSATPYLADVTGSRRFWSVRVRRFDLGRLAEVRDQLWAEAAIAEAAGEQIYLAVAAPAA